jgi:hypothetical protein
MSNNPEMVERVVEVLGRLQIGSSLEEQAVAALEASHHAELVEAAIPLVTSLNSMEERLSELTLASKASDEDRLEIRIGDLRALRAVVLKIGEAK